MKPIELKSIGTLIDERITAELKVASGNKDAAQRVVDLTIAIYDRLLAREKVPDYIQLENQLRAVLKTCWDAQEVVMTSQDNVQIATAARTAQTTNGQRNILIRTLDTLFNEQGITQLEKTYG